MNSNKPITIAHNATTAKLVGASREDQLQVQQMLSYMVDGAQFMSVGSWDGKSSFYDFGGCTFPAGFVVRVYREFKKRGRVVNLVRRPLPEPLGPKNPVVDAYPPDPRYDYQDQVVDLLCRYGQIIAQVATGGGKSRIAKLCFARIARPTLFLTTRGILMHQMRDAFIADMGIKVGIYGDDNWSTKPELMNVGMVQTFAARLEKKTLAGELEALNQRRLNQAQKEIDALKTRAAREAKKSGKPIDARKLRDDIERLTNALQASYPPKEVTRAEITVKIDQHMQLRKQTLELLASFELVILEEAHEASSNSYYEVMQACTSAHYRLALTGTPFMKDSQQANMQLEAASGPVAIRVSELMLIERGILARPYFKYMDVGKSTEGVYTDVSGNERTAKIYQSTPFQRAYELGITGHIARNEKIVRMVEQATSYGLSSMVLVQHKAHGRKLRSMLTTAGVRCTFIEGEHDQSERLAALNALRSGTIDCLIGSTILDVGVDCPAVGMVILAGGGKAEVALRQRIGRGLRAKKSGPNVCFIVDFSDLLNNHLRAHAQERRRIVESTPGFAENIVSEFPFEKLGLVKRAA